jgi:hypothetical protein
MKKFTKEYSQLMYESLEDKIGNKITDEYSSLKRSTLELLEKSVENYEELINVQNFIHDYAENPEKEVLEGFIEDSDIFDFYLKNQTDIDELCTKKEFFDKTPKEREIFTLYDFVIKGTKFAVQETMKILEKELFS